MAATPPAGTPLDEARAAFARAYWEAARKLYQAALDAEQSAEALDGLGQALWWLGEMQAGIEFRAKAFREYRRRGDAETAAYLASYLAGEYRIAGNASLARGWLGRAERLLDGLGKCSALGWLHIELSKRSPDSFDEERHAREAYGIARHLGDIDLEIAALSHVGLALISQGNLQEGLPALDEAMAGATGGEAEDPLAIGETCCMTLVACERLADVQRARDWSRAIVDFVEHRNFTPLSAWCRAIYAGFLTATGRWTEAERELERSLQAHRRLESSPLATLNALANLRIRQGRLEEAAQLLTGNEDRPAVLHPVVHLHLANGETDLATEKVERRLEAVAGNEAQVAPLLALRITVLLTCGDASGARETSRTLADMAARLGRDDLAATAKVYLARAARLAGDRPEADALEEAVEEFGRLELPFEEAEARLELARILAPARPHLAAERARAALATCDRLGAARLADEAAKLLRDLGVPGRPAPRTGGKLTKREQDVLRLLAAGLSNAAIAERLVISPKTAEHHVGRILAKLELRNRAEAAAYAVRSGSV